MVARPQINVARRKNPVPWGVVVHTTGRGVLDAATREKKTPAQVAEELYTRPDAYFPHYFIGSDGIIFQVADELIRARHVAVSLIDRARYLLNTWRSKVPDIGVELWQARWQGKKSPQVLYPSRSPNEDYLGVELIPQFGREKNTTLFTDKQYSALARLLVDIADRWQIPLLQPGSPRLVGHEDLSPLTRWDSIGGWDPGFLRSRPYFRWNLLPLPAASSPPVLG